MKPDKYPSFCSKIRVGKLEGPRLTPHTVDHEVKWYWTGNSAKLVRYEGRVVHLNYALFMMFSGESPLPGAHVRRKKGSDPDDVNPRTLYCKHTAADFLDDEEENEDLREFRALLDHLQVLKLSEVDEMVYFPLDPSTVKQACEDVGVEVDVELEEET